MAKLTYHEELIIRVGEASRAAMLAIARALLDLGDEATGEQYAAELNILVLLHSPVLIEYRGDRLDKGQHQIDISDDAPWMLDLPFKRGDLDKLPMSLYGMLLDTAWQANPWVHDWLKKMVEQEMKPDKPRRGPKSANGQSGKRSAALPETTATTGDPNGPPISSSGSSTPEAP